MISKTHKQAIVYAATVRVVLMCSGRFITSIVNALAAAVPRIKLRTAFNPLKRVLNIMRNIITIITASITVKRYSIFNQYAP